MYRVKATGVTQQAQLSLPNMISKFKFKQWQLSVFYHMNLSNLKVSGQFKRVKDLLFSSRSLVSMATEHTCLTLYCIINSAFSCEELHDNCVWNNVLLENVKLYR